MPEIDFFWIFVIGAIVVSTIVRGVRKVQARASREEWAAAAKQLGFSVTGNGRTLKIAGIEGSTRVAVDLVKKDNSTTTRYRVRVPPLGFDLGISRQSDWHQFVKAFGAMDLEIGNSEFDERFVVKTRNSDDARAYLTPARMAALNALAGNHPGFSFVDNTLLLSTGGVAKDEERIVSTVRDLMETARALLQETASAEPTAEGMPEAAESMATSEASAEKARSMGSTASGPDNEDRDEELQRVLETLEEYSGDLETNSAGDPPVIEPATSVEHDAAFMADRLFGDQRLGFEVERVFNEDYRDATVDWTGAVQRDGSLSAARRFEGEGHVIIEINVATLEDHLYGKTSVDAIVAFPAGTTIPDRGKTVRFSGRLIAIDALTKDLYVADGRVASA